MVEPTDESNRDDPATRSAVGPRALVDEMNGELLQHAFFVPSWFEVFAEVGEQKDVGWYLQCDDVAWCARVRLTGLQNPMPSAHLVRKFINGGYRMETNAGTETWLRRPLADVRSVRTELKLLERLRSAGALHWPSRTSADGRRARRKHSAGEWRRIQHAALGSTIAWQFCGIGFVRRARICISGVGLMVESSVHAMWLGNGVPEFRTSVSVRRSGEGSLSALSTVLHSRLRRALSNLRYEIIDTPRGGAPMILARKSCDRIAVAVRASNEAIEGIADTITPTRSDH